MTITFIGHGYVGLVTACVFADFGNQVYVVGHTKEKLEKLKKGDPIIYEPGLEELLKKNLDASRLIFTDSFSESVTKSDVVFIAVGTPPSASGEADLSAVYNVALKIGQNLKIGYTVISCKSTVPVGTNLKVQEIINSVKKGDSEFDVASCPEFLREGTAISDTLIPDRVVIGTGSKKAADVLIQVHKPLPGERVLTDLASAEIIKYASNAMLATKIAFANLISLYAEKTGGDIETITKAVGADSRIGYKFLNAGIGYGGSCFPKDVMALNETGKKLQLDTSLLDAVEKINVQVRVNFIEKIKKHIKGKNLGVWGLSFKPNTDDIRFAPSLYIITELLKLGYNITAYDPVAIDNVKKILGNKINYSTDIYETTKEKDGLLIFTEWNEFKQANLNRIKSSLKNKVIVDGRNIYEAETLKSIGINYISVGRPEISI